MKNLTVRNVPEAVSEALEREKRRRGASLNQTVIDLLGQALGVSGTRSNGLRELAGGWSEDQQRAFDEAVSRFESVDAELWE